MTKEENAMPNRVVVDKIESVAAAGPRSGNFAEVLPEVKFRNGQSAGLDPNDSRSTIFAEVLDDLKQSDLTAYVELDDVTSLVREVRVPLVDVVRSLDRTSTGDINVSLELSAALHILRHDNPDRDNLAKILESAAADRRLVAITEDHERGIIDVRNASPSNLPLGDSPGAEGRPSGPSSPNDSRLSGNLAEPPPLNRATVTLQLVSDLFRQMAGRGCNPSAVTPACIPFSYPDDGCYARAHLMCIKMEALGTAPEKVWLYGRLVVRTPCNPNCQVLWVYHVAPILRVTDAGRIRIMVIDPSLFSTPVTDADWKQIQGDPGALAATSDASIYYRGPDGRTSTDPDGSRTAQDLAQFRARLKLRAAQPGGPPPYAHCATPIVAANQ
jgi:Glutaminase